MTTDEQCQENGAPDDDLEQQLARAQVEIEQLNDKYLRSVAEFANYRRRQERDLQQQALRLKAAAFRSLLPVLDDLQLAIKNAPNDAREYDWMEGVLLIERKFLKILQDADLKPIETVGQPFDPSVHDAILRMPSEDQPEGHVVQEVQTGFLLGEEVVRPARVIVSGGPEQSEHETDQQD